jgi:hypothetical protein
MQRRRDAIAFSNRDEIKSLVKQFNKRKKIKIDQSKNELFQFDKDIDLANWYKKDDEQQNRVVEKMVKILLQIYQNSFPKSIDYDDKIEFFVDFIFGNISLLQYKQFDEFKTKLEKELEKLV